jgi:hypothetical protein
LKEPADFALPGAGRTGFAGDDDMAFLQKNLTTVHVVEGILPWLPPGEDEVRRCDAAAFAAGGLDRARCLHEFFLLKAALGLEYGMGLLETLGLRVEGIEQFHALYVQRLAEGVAEAFPNSRETALGLLAQRLKAYSAALHGKHPEDPHLGVADAFTRFCGAPDEPGLVRLCLDTCRSMNRRFLKELSDFGFKITETPIRPGASD